VNLLPDNRGGKNLGRRLAGKQKYQDHLSAIIAVVTGIKWVISNLWKTGSDMCKLINDESCLVNIQTIVDFSHR